MDSSAIGVITVQFYKRSPSVTEDIDICQSYMTALSSHHQYLCFSQLESSPKAVIISWPRPISGFELEIQCPLAKVSWKTVSHHGWPTKKILASLANLYLEMPSNWKYSSKMCMHLDRVDRFLPAPVSLLDMKAFQCLVLYHGKDSLKRKLFLSLPLDWK